MSALLVASNAVGEVTCDEYRKKWSTPLPLY